MSIKVSLNPEKKAGARRLVLMEGVGTTTFSLIELTLDETLRADVRWCWQHDLLEVVAANPLRYRATHTGLTMVTRGQIRRETMQADQEQVAA